MSRPLALALLAAGCGAVAAADVVILPDGFTLQGKWRKESELVSGPGGTGVVVNKAGGFDLVEDGPRLMLFSRHAGKGGKLEENAVRRDVATYTKKLPGRPGRGKSIAVLNSTVSLFNEKWEQEIKGTAPATPEFPNGSPVRIVRQITSLDPYNVGFDSYTHNWRPQYQTSEFPPKQVWDFLSAHPDVKEPTGKPDPGRRLLKIAFLRDVSLTDPSSNGLAHLKTAKDELAKLRAEVPALEKADAERADKLSDDILIAETRRVADELEACAASGRWLFGRTIATGFKPTALDPKEALRYAAAKTAVDAAWQRFEQTARLLDELLAGVGGPPGLAALGGGLGAASPLVKLTPTTCDLLTAAAVVRGELHPDTANRLELFAGQADARRRFAGAGAANPDALLALAVSGAVKGKNGADPDPAVALRAWAARDVALRYLRADTLNARTGLLDAYTGGKPAPADEVAQVVTLLPPADPLDPAAAGTPVPPADAEGGKGIVRRTTPPDATAIRGVPYMLRLPAEWHPGRTYPVLLALSDPSFPAEKLIGRLQEYADRWGYVVAAPQWGSQFRPDAGYDYRGLDHPAATAVLRDVLRRVRCDPDRVFVFGYGGGADFALDLGLSHPDLFAGVVANGAVPPLWLATSYWRNAQKLPMYFVCGELGSEYKALRPLFEPWMSRGFPALAAVYRGRGSPDFFAAELPRIFDWLGRKTRVRGTASLKLGSGGVEPWQVLREADDRFYWVGVGAGGLRRGNLLVNRQPGATVEPARFRADLGKNGTVAIDGVIGVRKFVVWLERDLIDWSKPLGVTVNGKTPIGYKPKVPQPDLHLLFDELYRTGDTKMLYLGKVEVDGPG